MMDWRKPIGICEDLVPLLPAAAEAATDIYTASPSEANFEYWRRVEQFRLTGELVAGVRFLDNRKTAVVAIRGTAKIGNWLFTNLQAHFTALNIVDDTLAAAESSPYQAGYLRTPIHGSLHQGFFRAFSWLWYGGEPILGHPRSSRAIGLSRLHRYVVLFFAIPVLVWLVAESNIVSAFFALAIAFVFVTFEAGIWEDIFKDTPRVEGTEPYKSLGILNRCDRVIFTGHSLGGAVATIAFGVYRIWCQSDESRSDNAVLVTFGAPRVGDVPFVEAFEALNKNRFCHVVHRGDPVPELPPNGLNELWCRRIWTRGPIGWIVILLFPFWAALGKLYRANRAARWIGDSLCMIESASRQLKFSNHSMEKVYRPWAMDSLRRWSGS